MAYCLLGLFDVNMPLLYGEGGIKAFVRLQLEILKKSSDESIFAWSTDGDPLVSLYWNGLLAPNPQLFGCYPEEIEFEMHNISYSAAGHRYPYSMTNKGLEFTLRIDNLRPTDFVRLGPANQTLFPLNCFMAKVRGKEGAVGTPLKKRSLIGLVILFEARVTTGPEVVVARRNARVLLRSELGGHRCHPDDFDFSTTQEHAWDARVVLNRRDYPEAKEWKVYFPQDGL